ncbi:MAG: DNA-processing protein DprA [Bacilli bacterium]|jgi:DNA processing protein
MEAREILIFLSIKYEGDWEKIYDAIKRKEPISENEIKESISKINCKTLTLIDADYPNYLKNIFKPPFVLYFYGDITLASDTMKCISFVGTRQMTKYGEEMTRKIVSEISPYKIIVSGLAKGIDRIAHETAINCSGRTIGVLGCGIDSCYPKENLELYIVMKKDHLIISEYPHKTEPAKQQFPQRNRLIAALSQATIVGEAPSVRSGTLITVQHALEMGRDVMCVPYPGNVSSMCNRLIKEGASLVESGDDVFQELHFTPEVDKKVQN